MAKKALIVDDEEDVCSLLRLVLEKRGLEVQTAGDGQEALEQIKKVVPDLILLDLKMPRVGGYQLYARLKADPHYQKIPIVVVTSLTQDSDVDDAGWQRRMEADGFLTKPFELEELGRRVDEIVGKLL